MDARPFTPAAVMVAVLLVGPPARAENRPMVDDAPSAVSVFLRATHLIEIKQGSDLSRKVSSVQGSGFESSQGAWISMRPWYGSRWTDSSIAWMTQVNPNLGVIWGLGTGERGEKFTIAPSLKLGVVAQAEPRKNHFISLKTTAVLGGHLKERACTADYGEIGGVQAVNCRMAATTLPPSETLKYLFNDRPTDRWTLLLQYKTFF